MLSVPLSPEETWIFLYALLIWNFPEEEDVRNFFQNISYLAIKKDLPYFEYYFDSLDIL